MPRSSFAARAFCVAAAAFLFAHAGAQTPSNDKVKIGVLTDLSGPYADATGKGSVEAVRMAIEDFGGKVLGKPVELVSADHLNRPDLASSIARKWFDTEGVDAVFDLPNAAAAIAVVNLARERNKVVMITAASSVALTNENCAPTSVHYVFDTYSFAKGVSLGMSKRGAKTWYIVGADYTFGKQLAANITEFVEASGGKVVGSAFHPLNSPDMSSFMLKAAASGADVIALANATNDTVNSIMMAQQFGITPKQAVVPLLLLINDVQGMGLKTAQGMTFTSAFYWDRTPETRAWSRRYFERMKKMPSDVQAGNYSAALTYLKAVQAAGTVDGARVAEKMKETPINDFFAQGGHIREDGQMVHDLYLVQVKKPSESKYPWDFYNVLSVIPGNEAFQPLSASKCPLVKK